MERKVQYFEGWYFKHQHKEQMFSVIPGIILDKSGDAKAFIQFITPEGSYFLDYDKKDFHICRNPLKIRIGENFFTKKGIRLRIDRPGLHVQGKLLYRGIRKPQKPIMGPFEMLPQMECYHGILSYRHRLSGTLRINQQLWDFTRGTGYIETDRGMAFPTKYVWTHCHHELPKSDCSVMAAIARIPIGPITFYGTIAHIHYRNREYRLGTYSGCRIRHVSAKGFCLVQGCYRLKVTFLEGKGRPLMAPAAGKMERIIYEDLATRIRYEFYQGERLLFHFISHKASMEYQMD